MGNLDGSVLTRAGSLGSGLRPSGHSQNYLVHRSIGPSWRFLSWPSVQLFAGLNADHVATREAVLKIVTDLVFFFLAGQLLNAQPENGRALEWFGLIVTLLAISLCILALAQILWSNVRKLFTGLCP